MTARARADLDRVLGQPGCVADFNALAPAVSFSKDVAPIFKQSCAFSTCHGATSGSSNGVFLGSDTARVHTGLVNVRGDELTTMPFVIKVSRLVTTKKNFALVADDLFPAASTA